MTTYILWITGMTCNHCAKSIEEALSGMAGVVKAEVSYEHSTAQVEINGNLNSRKLVDAVNTKVLAPICWSGAVPA